MNFGTFFKEIVLVAKLQPQDFAHRFNFNKKGTMTNFMQIPTVSYF